jgi:hypothetical protein
LAPNAVGAPEDAPAQPQRGPRRAVAVGPGPRRAGQREALAGVEHEVAVADRVRAANRVALPEEVHRLAEIVLRHLRQQDGPAVAVVPAAPRLERVRGGRHDPAQRRAATAVRDERRRVAGRLEPAGHGLPESHGGRPVNSHRRGLVGVRPAVHLDRGRLGDPGV